MIIDKTYEFLKASNAELLYNAKIEKVVLGFFFTAVKLSSGFCGMAKTEIVNNCCNSNKSKRSFGDFSPGKIQGQRVIDLFEKAEKSNIIENVRLATLNAISSEIISHSAYHVIEDKDPIDLLDLSKEKTVCIVGAFQSYINKIAATSNKLFVLELNENAFTEDQKRFYVPDKDYAKTFAKSDIIVITGSTIANNTLDDLLASVPENALTILVGPSSSIIPDILFQKGVDIIGSTKILDAEKMFTIISEGGTGYHLFNTCAKKICIVNDSPKTSKKHLA